MANLSWYLVYTKPMRETVAKQQLENQDFNVFLPMATVKKRVRGVLKQRKEPFFQRYLFIQLDAETDNWSPIRSTVGVVGLVRFGGVAAQVPDSVVQLLQDSAGSLDAMAELGQYDFATGDQLQIIAGPFAGYEVEFSSMCSTERASVLLKVASRYTKMQINTAFLEKT